MTYVHRPEGTREVSGADITSLGPDSFERRTRSRRGDSDQTRPQTRQGWRPGRIPYHRVTRIEVDGEPWWERRTRKP